MELSLELAEKLEQSASQSPNVAGAAPGAKSSFRAHESRQPAFIDTFQQIIDGLPEQIALVDDHWTILAVNPAWTRTAALYSFDVLSPGANYLAFLEEKAKGGHSAAQATVDAIHEMRRSGSQAFQFVYDGSGPWADHAFQLCLKRLEVGGRSFVSVTRYDVTELVHLRQMREGFSQLLIQEQGTERRRMARELHDSTMQHLAALGLSIGCLKQSEYGQTHASILAEMDEMLSEAQIELRAISFLAHPPKVAELGLREALRQLAGGFGRRTGLRIATNAVSEIRVAPAAEVAIYRFIQEALSNIHRHARATEAAIRIYDRRSTLHVLVEDNGIGIPGKLRPGVGLSSMRERIKELGGRLMVRNGHPGAVFVASLPARPELRAVGDLAQQG